MATIKLAKTAGFCYGVNRAVDMIYGLLDEKKKAVTLGPIIHNMEMVRELKEKGIRPVDSIEEADLSEIIVIRSHGVPKQVIDDINQKGNPLLDATCPFVAKIHRIVRKAGLENKFVLIAGDSGHPEVQGIMGHCTGECMTFKNREELSEIMGKIPQEKQNSLILVAQTTFDTQEWKKCLKILKKVYTNAEIFDTICNATSERQNILYQKFRHLYIPF